MNDSVPRESVVSQAIRFDHACFGCGHDNPIGLRLRVSQTDDGVTAAFTPGPVHQGFDGIVHGGIISTVLDEAMAWATTNAGVWTVTADIRVRFKQPLSVGEPTTVTARVTENRGRLISTAGNLTRDRDGAVIATATGTFVRVSDAVAKAWESRYLANGSVDEDLAGGSIKTLSRPSERGETSR